jgi:hypothetical protein
MGDKFPSAEADLAWLCRSCGLCCDGSLFGRADLAPEEVDAARRHRLRVVRNAKSFEQPCTALVNTGAGRTCSIYESRPHACRRFTCRLYERHQLDGGPIEARLAIVRRVRFLLAQFQAWGWTAADFETSAQDDGTNAARLAYLELTRSMEEDFARADR